MSQPFANANYYTELIHQSDYSTIEKLCQSSRQFNQFCREPYIAKIIAQKRYDHIQEIIIQSDYPTIQKLCQSNSQLTQMCRTYPISELIERKRREHFGEPIYQPHQDIFAHLLEDYQPVSPVQPALPIRSSHQDIFDRLWLED